MAHGLWLMAYAASAHAWAATIARLMVKSCLIVTKYMRLPVTSFRLPASSFRFLCLALFLAVAACSGTPPSDAVAQIPPPPDVAAAPADATRTSTNMATKVIAAGTGSRHPRPNSTVTVHYTGWTTDGRTFDSSITRGEPSTFSLDRVIPGWTEGVQMMVEGEKRRFWIPGRLAYEGAPGKPQGTLVFDIELIRIVS